MKTALLLGEAPNANIVPPSRWDKVQAFDALPNSSGQWLKTVLKSDILEDWNFILENSVTIHRVMKKWSRIDRVVALSRTVAECFQIPYVPHPAYYRRFVSAWGHQDYAKLLFIELEKQRGENSRTWQWCQLPHISLLQSDCIRDHGFQDRGNV